MTDFFLHNPIARSFYITSRFNTPRNYSYSPQRLQLHEGLDLAAVDAAGTPVAVLAAQRGVVDKVGYSPNGYGNYARMVHDWPDGTRWVTWYGHMSAVSVEEGQFLMAGQKIGIAGTTGMSTGIHLHITVQHIGFGLKNYVIDDVLDPEPLFNFNAPPVNFDEATFVLDVTVPDGMVKKPGETFEKTWRVRNTGTTEWKPGYALVFAGDERMSAPERCDLVTVPVQMGQLTDVSLKMVAPSKAGKHRSTWQFCTPDGTVFGCKLFTEIEVKEPTPCDEASFVADITIEDGTIVQPGEQFLKKWRVQNTGTTTWTDQYSLRFVADNRMGGPAKVSLTQPVKPGDFAEIAVTLTAPTTPGRQRSTWKLHNADGQPFEYNLYAEIQVPKKTSLSGTLSEARWVADVTIPDESKVKPGVTFVKTWRVRNTGTKAWKDGYTLAFFGDEQLGGPESIPLPFAQPGETVDISVTLTAPTTPGRYRSTWKGRDPKDKFFEFDLFTIIRVVPPDIDSEQLDEMSWVADVTIEDGSPMLPGEAFVKTWRIRNTGMTTWEAGYELAFFGDEKMDGPDRVALPPAKPGETVEVSLLLTAPTELGLHKSTWKGRNPQGKVFEYEMFALIEVIQPG